MKRQEIIEKLRACKEKLATEFGIESIGLFGSYAKDTATVESDIDLIYVPKEGVTFGLEKRILLEEYLREVLQVSRIDLVNHRYINPIVKLSAEKDLVYV
jgi:predicted nucleotidyltransferase